MTDNIQFKVGNKYRNRRGLFEVISVRDDSMIIEWENGVRISTTQEKPLRDPSSGVTATRGTCLGTKKGRCLLLNVQSRRKRSRFLEAGFEVVA